MEVRTAIDRVLEEAVVRGDVPGVVAVAGDDRGTVYEGAFGKRSAGGDAEMTVDTVFWVASMTKAITSVAALQQVEQGRLSLDEPLHDVLPELGRIKVLDGFAADGTPRLRDPRRPITLRRLLTHTAGFVYDIWNADMGRYMKHQGIPGIIECRNVTLQTPLMFDPGDRWDYGINIDWAGKAVEKVTGQTLEEYFRDRIFGPLGMASSGFVLDADRRARLAAMHARMPDGTLSPIPFEIPQQPEFFMGGGGLYSTAGDYLRFLRALLGGGTLDGAQILRPETVAEINRNQIEFFPGMVKKWGLACMITTEAAPTGRSAGSLAWAGLGNTYYWLDPAKQVAGVICTQILPFGDAKVLDLFAGFEQAVYEEHDR
jgi:methyl acetate hydrolase